jgi:uncharacterized protein (TIGR02246 family)
MKALLGCALAMVLVLSAVGPAPAQTSNAGPTGSRGDREFTGLIQRYYDAWNTLDAEKAGEFYAKDADLVFYDIAPFEYHGWTEYKEGVKKTFFEKMTNGKLTPNHDLRVARRGDVAWTTVTFHLSAVLKTGGAMEIEARHTAIWVKRGGRWLIVHEHVSVPLPD